MTPVGSRWPVIIWLAFAGFCIFIVSRMQIGADLSAFLPDTPTPAQRLLTEQLRDGVVSRLILVGIEGGEIAQRADASRKLALRLREEPGYVSVNNGEAGSLERDQAYLFDNRYLLSPAVTPERYSSAGLRDSLQHALQLLGSPAGTMFKHVLPRDPGGELLHLVEGFAGQRQPENIEGVWMSQDGVRALLILQTAAAGYDIDAQQQAVEVARRHFEQVAGEAGGSGLRFILSGPGVFSVEARDSIESVASHFSVITAILVSLLLFFVYRSWLMLAISLLPVASGALAGIAAVSLGYGVVYGVTLGFGITLIGEAVDYAIFFFTRLSRGAAPQRALENIWPTLRLGVLTTICGFGPMFLADFPGLAQLGLFSVTGLVVAVLVTRWVLPHLVRGGFAAEAPMLLAHRIVALIAWAPKLRPVLLVMVIASAIFIVLQREPLWSSQLSSLSPVPESQQMLDQSLRDDLGAPDVRYLLVVGGGDREEALERSETAGRRLDELMENGALAGYDTPARYLPSRKTQLARQAALPEDRQLRANLKRALEGLPFRDGLFEPFFAEAAAARSRPLLTAEELRGTNAGLQVESLLVHYRDGWKAMLPLRGVSDIASVRRVFDKDVDIVALDLKQESDTLYQSYVHEAVMLSAAGMLAIVLLLFASLRSVGRVIAVLLPLAAAVTITMAILLAGGQKLLLFHLVGLLLAVAIGSNYSLFFDRAAHTGQQDEDGPLTMVSLLVANVSTSIAFGMLSFSGVPVLTAIGQTVAIGAFLSLLFSAVLMGGKAAR